jgi:hypothetical protein
MPDIIVSKASSGHNTDKYNHDKEANDTLSRNTKLGGMPKKTNSSAINVIACDGCVVKYPATTSKLRTLSVRDLSTANSVIENRI